MKGRLVKDFLNLKIKTNIIFLKILNNIFFKIIQRKKHPIKSKLMGSCLKRKSNIKNIDPTFKPNENIQVSSNEKLLNTSGQTNIPTIQNEESYHTKKYSKASYPEPKHVSKAEDFSIKRSSFEEKLIEENIEIKKDNIIKNERLEANLKSKEENFNNFDQSPIKQEEIVIGQLKSSESPKTNLFEEKKEIEVFDLEKENNAMIEEKPYLELISKEKTLEEPIKEEILKELLTDEKIPLIEKKLDQEEVIMKDKLHEDTISNKKQHIIDLEENQLKETVEAPLKEVPLIKKNLVEEPLTESPLIEQGDSSLKEKLKETLPEQKESNIVEFRWFT